MEAREGYKKTELGWIPEDWKTVKFGDIFTERIEQNTNNLPLLSVTNSNGVVYRDTLKKRDTSPSDKSKYKKVCPGDIAYNTMRLWQGVSALSPYAGVVSPAYTVLKPQKNIHPPYYQYLMKTQLMISWFLRYSSGICSDTNNCKFKAFRKILAILPPLPEQQKIAEILTTVDDKISSIEDRIQQTEQLKKGLMEKLLTEGIGHKEFKDTEIGRMPASWDVQKIGSICDVKGGKRLPKGDSLVDEDTGYPYIRVADMFMGGVKTNALKFVPVETVSKIKNYIINKEDLFISVAGTLGIVGKIPAVLDGANLTENADKLTNITIDRHFLFFVLSSEIIQGVIQKEATINALPKLAIQKIKTFLLPIPPLPEQNQIAAILSAVDDKIDILQSKKANYETLKKGLMEQLLTGKIRVKV